MAHAVSRPAACARGAARAPKGHVHTNTRRGLGQGNVTGCNRRTDDTDRPLDARDDEEISYDRFDRFDRFLTVFDRFVAVLCATDLSEEELIADRRLLSRTSVR